MNLAIIGTRDFPGSPETVATAIAQHSLAPTAVLCGEARGPDTWGRLWAKRRGIPVYLVGGVMAEQLSLGD